MSYPVISDKFKTVVTATGTALGKSVFFHHGHILEISNTIIQMSTDPDTDKRFPFIALERDIKNEKHVINGTEFEATIYLIELSDPNYTAEERLINIFKTSLTPLFDKFVLQIAKSRLFREQTIEEVNENSSFIEHYFWGRAQVMGNEANIFGDWVDCIEFKTKLTALMSC